jgi:hypothetical protein
MTSSDGKYHRVKMSNSLGTVWEVWAEASMVFDDQETAQRHHFQRLLTGGY